MSYEEYKVLADSNNTLLKILLYSVHKGQSVSSSSTYCNFAPAGSLYAYAAKNALKEKKSIFVLVVQKKILTLQSL